MVHLCIHPDMYIRINVRNPFLYFEFGDGYTLVCPFRVLAVLKYCLLDTCPVLASSLFCPCRRSCNAVWLAQTDHNVCLVMGHVGFAECISCCVCAQDNVVVAFLPSHALPLVLAGI